MKLFEYLSNTRVGELYWDKTTGNFFDFKGYNKNEKYFTNNGLKYVGKFVRCETWGYGDGSGAAVYFDKGDGVIERIEYVLPFRSMQIRIRLRVTNVW